MEQKVERVEHVLPLGDNFTTNLVAFAPSGTDCHETFVPERVRFTTGERGAQSVVDFGLGILTTTFHVRASPVVFVAVIGMTYVDLIGSNFDVAIPITSVPEYERLKLKYFVSGADESQVTLNLSVALTKSGSK
jgi:hypothetical protein